MCAWITLDKPSREHIFSHFLCHRKGISLAAREGFNSSRKYRNDKNILMTHLFCSVSRSCLTLCNPHGLQHARLPRASPTPRAFSNLCPLSRWCQPIFSSSVVPFSSCLQSFPASGSFPMSQFFTLGRQNTGASASASVLPMNIKEWYALELTG